MNIISSNLQYAGACINSTAKYVQDSLTPSQATIDKAYNVAMVALKTVGVLAAAATIGAIGYAFSKSDISKDTLAKASAATVVAFITINALLFPESAKGIDKSQAGDSHFKKLASDEREEEAKIKDKEEAAAQASRTLNASTSMHGGRPHAPVGTRN